MWFGFDLFFPQFACRCSQGSQWLRAREVEAAQHRPTSTLWSLAASQDTAVGVFNSRRARVEVDCLPSPALTPLRKGSGLSLAACPFLFLAASDTPLQQSLSIAGPAGLCPNQLTPESLGQPGAVSSSSIPAQLQAGQCFLSLRAGPTPQALPLLAASSHTRAASGFSEKPHRAAPRHEEKGASPV